MTVMRVAVLVVWLAGACEGTIEVPVPPKAPAGGFGIVVEPRLGRVVNTPTTSTELSFVGLHEHPNYELQIQVLDDPALFDSWVTIAVAKTDVRPSSTDVTMYEWRVDAAPAQLSPARWPQGGIMRVRVIGAGGEVLTSLFHDSDPCLTETVGWRERAAYCGAELHNGIVIASAADVTTSQTRPRFLDRKGWIDPAATQLYYEAIAAPPTLTEFRTTYAFDTTAPELVYFNHGDLGIGRELACQSQLDGALACVVANYGQFGGDATAALDLAVAGSTIAGQPFVTAAMVYRPPYDAPNSTQFMVYGADGALVTEARLDSVGDNASIPNNCLNCHGSTGTYDPVTRVVTGARLLPLDPAAMTFSTRTAFRAGDQIHRLAQINGFIAGAAPTEAMLAFLDSQNPTDAALASFLPPGWDGTTLERKFYEHVVAANCRSCHWSRDDFLTFETAVDFHLSNARIEQVICVERNMPNAEVPLRRLWAGPARAYLAAYLGLASCNP
jgi:hypothetical protein